MPTPHSSLTGADLHETKGADTAGANTVLVANGSGSTVFQKITEANVNLTSIKNVNVEKYVFACAPATAFDFYIPIDAPQNLVSLSAQINNVVTGANVVIDLIKNSTTIGTVTFPIVGTSAGSKVDLILGSPVSFTTADNFRIRTTATGVTASGTVVFVFNFKVV